jgi:protoporphyrin/coproporphyrin ferrochelatase
MKSGVLLVAHGTVDSLDDLPEFLANIRRGHAPSPELLAEVRRRYEAIGGQSPLNAINRELAATLETKLGVPVRTANRLFHPYPKVALEELAALGVTRVIVVPLAQHSAKIYGEAVEAAAREVASIREVRCAANWGRHPLLTKAFATEIQRVVAPIPAGEGALVTTAHSLPLAVVQAGDPSEEEVRASAADVAAELTSRGVRFAERLVAFQSQGMSTGPGGRPIVWLGPDLKKTLEELAERGRKHVVVAPIGFLADHVEILYDLDIEAKGWADELGITLHRSASLNAGDGIVSALAEISGTLLGG